jgi:fluoroacetyl-CoA thioesterase
VGRSGDLPVFATPALVALCEEAAVNVLKDGLSEGETTVGTRMEISHDAASCLNATITAYARVDGLDGRMITLSVWAQDEAGVIGRGVHQRARVKNDRLLAKAKQRLFGPRSCPQ